MNSQCNCALEILLPVLTTLWWYCCLI